MRTNRNILSILSILSRNINAFWGYEIEVQKVDCIDLEESEKLDVLLRGRELI